MRFSHLLSRWHEGPASLRLAANKAPGLTTRKARAFFDHVAAGVVRVGGGATIVSILAIFVYLLIEVWPLFLDPTASEKALVHLNLGPVPQTVSAVGTDEYQEVAFVIRQGVVTFYRLSSGKEIPVEGSDTPLKDRQVMVVARSGGRGNHFGLGMDDGSVIPVTVTFTPTFEHEKRTMVPHVSFAEPIMADPTHLGIAHLAIQNRGDAGILLAVVTQTGHVWLTKQGEGGGLLLAEEPVLDQVELAAQSGEGLSGLLLDGEGEHLLMGFRDGHVVLWNIQDFNEPRRMGDYVVSSPDNPITALSYLIGDRTVVIGTKRGTISTWMLVRDSANQGTQRLQTVHSFRSHSGSVTAISPSRRDKGFLTADANGEISLHHSTSGQTLLTWKGTGSSVRAMMFAPKANGVIVLDEIGRLRTISLHNPHPEITFHTLFQPVLYEGYDKPAYSWQSSSGSDDFEPKFSLMPLIFGTLKGTVYAMILAIPLAVMGAIYTAMFMSPGLRAIVKPAIEIMAALPSVVLGFLAGLWLAPVLEQIFPAVVAMVVVIPLSVTLSSIAWQFAPKAFRLGSRGGIDLLVLLGVLVVTVVGCLAANQQVESWLFQSDYKMWLQSTFGLQYDQRNALIISFAMGFAVIPIIFSISEDSIANVPKHLIAGSLAMGATPWQTLTRLVLVSASPGIFSALMIGFGRAVGETMIVLMATGNTPILDWSMFNGFRTLSANIAVEMPEAPQGGTLYRVLFLSGLLLFAFTFVLNTIAEIVRQRLRTKYSRF